MTDDSKLSEALTNADDAREGSAAGTLRKSLNGWRDTLVLDNGLVFLVNVVCVAIGAGVVLQTTGALVWIGGALAVMGALGILDAVAGRLIK